MSFSSGKKGVTTTTCHKKNIWIGNSSSNLVTPPTQLPNARTQRTYIADPRNVEARQRLRSYLTKQAHRSPSHPLVQSWALLLAVGARLLTTMTSTPKRKSLDHHEVNQVAGVTSRSHQKNRRLLIAQPTERYPVLHRLSDHAGADTGDSHCSWEKNHRRRCGLCRRLRKKGASSLEIA